MIAGPPLPYRAKVAAADAENVALRIHGQLTNGSAELGGDGTSYLRAVAAAGHWREFE